jgi:hypothetical protein
VPTPTEAGMPPDTELDNGCTVTFDAIDPTTGAAVAGVQFTDGVLYVDVTEGSAADLQSGPFMLVPGPGA